MDWRPDRRTILSGGMFLGLSGTAAFFGSRDNAALEGAVSLRDYGADPTGSTSSVASLKRALAAGTAVAGSPGEIYLLDQAVPVPAGRNLIGNGATLRLAPGTIGLRLDQDRCTVTDWRIEGNGGLYTILNTGDQNTFTNNHCTGDIGHFFFCTGASNVTASGNRIDGMTASREITTAIVVERSRGVRISDNHFHEIPVGWAIQVRDGSHDFVVADNQFVQTRWSDTRIAGRGQRIFRFSLGSACHLKKIQVNGLPLSVGYVVEGSGPDYIVTFRVGRAAGEAIRLVGYRGAENIQVNTGSHHGRIVGNRIDGTGDSGIICLGEHLILERNDIRNCGYAGIAIYGDQDHIIVRNNIVSDCAQMDDALSSPDDPDQASVFAGAILASGEDAVICDNVIRNPGGTMRYGIRVNKANMKLRTDGSAAIDLARNRFEGSYADGRIFAPNETPGARVNSIAMEGEPVEYPGRIDLQPAWTNAPPGGPAIKTGGYGRTWAIRDAEKTRRRGAASLRTVAGEYVDFTLTQALLLRDCIVTIDFWAQASAGNSYVSVFTVLEGLPYPLTVPIAERHWKHYTVRFPLTPNLADVIVIRCGAETGSANIQDIAITAVRL